MPLKTLLVIDVNSRGSLIPGRGGQSLARETALQTVLPWIVERVSQSRRRNSIVVLMKSTDARAMATRVPSVATVIASDESNGLSRLLLAADAFDAEAIIKVDFETPLVDPALIDILLESARQNPSADYVSFREGNEPAKHTAGKFAEWCRVSALRQAGDFSPGRGESPTSVLHSNPERFEVRYLKLAASKDRSNLRVRMDSPQDIKNVKDFIARVQESPSRNSSRASSGLRAPNP